MTAVCLGVGRRVWYRCVTDPPRVDLWPGADVLYILKDNDSPGTKLQIQNGYAYPRYVEFGAIGIPSKRKSALPQRSYIQRLSFSARVAAAVLMSINLGIYHCFINGAYELFSNNTYPAI